VQLAHCHHETHQIAGGDGGGADETTIPYCRIESLPAAPTSRGADLAVPVDLTELVEDRCRSISPLD
jgi:hypothetical protein